MKAKKILASIIVSAVLVTSNLPYLNCTRNNIAYAGDSGDFSLSGDTLTINKGSDKIDVQICSSRIVKVNYKPDGSEDPETLIIDPNKKWETGNIKSKDLDSNPAVIKTDDMTIKIDKSSLTMDVLNSDGTSLVQKADLAKSKEVSFTHGAGQDFYGISGYNKDKYPQDGTKRNENSEITCGSQGYVGGPFAWTPSGYGILVDTDGGKYNPQDNKFSISGISKKNTEYFIMVGNPTEVMESEAEISGKAPMYPKWACGFTNTQWGWPNDGGTPEDQLKAVIKKYRTEGYPIDNFCLDFDWKQWGQLDKPSGEFKWNTDNFPSAKDDSLKKWAESEGIHLTGIMKPRLFINTEEAKTMDENGWWYTDYQDKDYCSGKQFKNCDFYNEGLRKWWWEQSQDAFDKGISGFWNDECDIENKFRNFDNLNMQRAIYEGQRQYTKDQTRVWSINRNFYTGAQRYGYGSWSGDIESSFQSMKAQTYRLIAAVNIGEAKWGMDTGGFNGTPQPENYARWVEFSAFTPIFRVHGQKVPDSSKVRYPWAYGETAAAAAKDVMHLRYQLIPYIYKYDHQASETGVGLVKSMMMAYPNDPKSSGNVDEWMFGDYMLVSPVLEQNQETKNIYLPEGNWIDYATGEKYVGGKEVQHKVDTTGWKDVPLFIKQGAIIPSQDYENYVGEKKMDNIYVDVFPDSKETSFEYYDDDGDSYDYENGNYFKQKLSVSRNDDWSAVSFKTGPKEGDYKPDVKSYIVKLHVKSKGAVKVNNKELTECTSLEELQGLGSDEQGYVSSKDKYGDVVYVKIKAGEVQTVEAPCDFEAGPEQTSNVYVENADSSDTLEYSADAGRTWEECSSPLEPSGCLGYVGSTVTCSLKSNALKVRVNKDGDYFPSEDGISLTASSGNFMLTKDGDVKQMTSMNSTKLYIMSDNDDSDTPVLVQYKDGSSWSDSIKLEPFGSSGGYFKELLYSDDKSDLTIRYSDDNGKTWKPSDNGTKVQTGEYQSSDDGSLIEGKPNWGDTVTIYYKTDFDKTYIHWHADGGDWTNAPGQEMQNSTKFPGYAKIVLDVGNGSYAEGCFNDGGDNWDNNNKENYKIEKGIFTVKDGKITSGDPDGKHSNNNNNNNNNNKKPTVSCSVKGGTYKDSQKVKLSSSDSKAAIYYTTDGSVPTEKSDKYSEPIEITEDTTLKFIAIDSNGNKSAVNTQKYVISDDIVKEITVSCSIKGGTYTDTQKIELSASDDSADIYYTTDGSEPTEDSDKYSSPIKITENTTLKFIAIDKDGNKSKINTQKYVINKDNPIEYDKLNNVNLVVSNSSADKGDIITLTASCNTDDPSVKYEFGYYDQNDKYNVLKSYSSNKVYKWTANKEGKFEVVVKAKSDNVSEIESKSKQVTVNKANEETKRLTSVTINCNDCDIKLGEKTVFTAEPDYDDGSVVYEFGYYDEDGQWNKLSNNKNAFKFTWTPEEEGTYEIRAKAKSEDTNKEVTSDPITVKVTKDNNGQGTHSFDNSNIIGMILLLSLSGAVVLGKNYRRKINK